MNEGPKPLEPIYEDPDAALGGNFQRRFAQDKEVRAAANLAYSTELQLKVLQYKKVNTEENLAYSVVSTTS